MRNLSTNVWSGNWDQIFYNVESEIHTEVRGKKGGD